MPTKTPDKISPEILEELKSYPLSYKLQQIRLLLGYTQKEASELIGCTQASMSTWENGKSPPCESMLLKIIQVYGLPMNYFVDHTVEKVKVQSKRSFIVSRTKKAKKRFDDVDLI